MESETNWWEQDWHNLSKYMERVGYIRSTCLCKPNKILDCASGDGRKGMLKYLESGLPPECFTAVDVNIESLTKLKKYRVKCVHANLEKVKLHKILSDEFDTILCVETLEHLTTRTQFKLLKSFVYLLKCGGSLVITFPTRVECTKKKVWTY